MHQKIVGSNLIDVLDQLETSWHLVPVFTESGDRAFHCIESGETMASNDLVYSILGNLFIEYYDNAGNQKTIPVRPNELWHRGTPMLEWKPSKPDSSLSRRDEWGKAYLNTYKPPEVKFEGEISPETRKYYIDVLNFHIDELLAKGDKEIGKWIRQFTAHMFQKPWERPTVSAIIRSGKGTGKGAYLEYLLQNLLGSMYKEIDTADKKSNCEDNIEFWRSLIACYKEGAIKGEEIGMLRNKITNRTLKVKQKGIKTMETDTYSRVWAETNDEIAVKMKGDDRRFTFIECSTFNYAERQSKEYNEMMDAVAELSRYSKAYQKTALEYFMEVDISDFNPFKPLPTKEAEYQMELNKSAIANWFTEYVHNEKYEGNVFDDRKDSISKLMDDGTVAIKAACVIQAYKDTLPEKQKAFFRKNIAIADLKRDCKLEYKSVSFSANDKIWCYIVNPKDYVPKDEEETSIETCIERCWKAWKSIQIPPQNENGGGNGVSAIPNTMPNTILQKPSNLNKNLDLNTQYQSIESFIYKEENKNIINSSTAQVSIPNSATFTYTPSYVLSQNAGGMPKGGEEGGTNVPSKPRVDVFAMMKAHAMKMAGVDASLKALGAVNRAMALGDSCNAKEAVDAKPEPKLKRINYFAMMDEEKAPESQNKALSSLDPAKANGKAVNNHKPSPMAYFK